MAAPIVALAEDIKDYLNTLTLSQTFTAVRRNLVRDDLSTAQTLNVYVVPRAMESEGITREQDQASYFVDIAISKAATADSDIDDLLEFVDEIGRNLTRYQPATEDKYFSQVNDPIYSQDMIDQQNVFLSVITVGYKALRATP